MANDIEAGFERVEVLDDFNQTFGDIFLNPERSQLAFRVMKRHLNRFGMCHGGAIAAFADMQLHAVKPAPGIAEIHTPTVSMAVDYIAPAQLDDWVVAAVHLSKATRSMVFTQADMTVGETLVARTHGIYRNYMDRSPTDQIDKGQD